MPLHPRRTIRRNFIQRQRARAASTVRMAPDSKIHTSASQAIARENVLACATALSDMELISLLSDLIRDDRL